MKKIKNALLALAAVATAVSCQEEEVMVQSEFAPMTITAVSEGIGMDTKVEMAYKYDLLWQEGDKIHVTDGNSSDIFTLAGGAGTDKGTFTQDGTASLSGEVQAYYPQDLVAGDKLVWPAVQTTKQTVPMYCKKTLSGTTDEQMDFKSLGAVLQIAFSTPTSSINLKSIELRDSLKTMSGAFHVDENGIAVMDGTDAAGIVLEFDEEVPVSNKISYFNMAVPAGAYKNLTISFITDDESVCTFTGGAITLAHNSVGKLSLVGKRFINSEKVDLGLSVKWRAYNLDVTKPEECGSEYLWSYLNSYCAPNGNYSKYVPSNWSGYWAGTGNPDNMTVLEPEDDAAHMKLGGNWRLPTKDDWEELMNENKCKWTWTTLNGVRGYKVQSRVPGFTDSWIFLPCPPTESCFYWSSTIDVGEPDMAYRVWVANDRHQIGTHSRNDCYYVRPVYSDMGDHRHHIEWLPGNVAGIETAGYKGAYRCTDAACAQYFEDSDATVLIGGKAEYEAWKSEGGRGYIEPLPLPEIVDLGLSVKWRGWDLGASYVDEYGDQYQWAGREKVSDYSVCPYFDGSSWTKYNADDSKTSLDADDDAAHLALGGYWRTPTKAEWDELMNAANCTWTWTEYHGKNGYMVQSKNGGRIFLPAAANNLHYWSSTLYTDPSDAYCVDITSGSYASGNAKRNGGLSIRPVYVKMESHTHNLVKVSGKEADMQNDGYKEAYLCTEPVCAQYFEDARGTVLIGGKTEYEAWKSKGGKGYIGPVEMVNLGLSVKWRSWNLGASKLDEYGSYYQWAGTQEATANTNYSICPYYDGSVWSKYTSTDSKTVLDPEDDAAHLKLGGSWRMPTADEWAELINADNCTWTWETINGVSGYKVQSKKAGFTDNWIFLPAYGYMDTSKGSLYAEKDGFYWSSSLEADRPAEAHCLNFGEGYINGGDLRSCTTTRREGLLVRPVSD